MTYKNRNPYRDAPEIDYNVAVIFLPSTFMGSSVGILLSYILPNVLMSLLLVSVLLFSTYRTLLTGFELWNKEINNPRANFYNSMKNQPDEHDSEDEYIEDEADEISLSTITDGDLRNRMNQAKLNTTISTVMETGIRKKSTNSELFPLDRILDNESKHVQWDKIKYVVVTLSVMVIATVFLGNKDVKSLLGISH